MPIFTWNKSYSVGVDLIDNEHRILISMINAAYEALKTQTDETVLRQLASEMRNYALIHFANEAGLMVKHNYPDADAHMAIHAAFVENAQVMGKEKNGIAPSTTIEAVSYLADWLDGHILGTDKKLGEFLSEKGIC